MIKHEKGVYSIPAKKSDELKKEKKEANLVLLQDLAEWEEKELGPDVVKQLHSMWEVKKVKIIYDEINFIIMKFLSLLLYLLEPWWPHG